MGQVIFAHPRHNYQSYNDYQRLIDLAGYPTCFIDEMDTESDNCYIFSTAAADWHKVGWAGAKATIIYWDLEHYTDVTFYDIPGLAGVWCSDARYAKRVGGKHVPMGSDARLAGYATVEDGTTLREWQHIAPVHTYEEDVTFLSHMTFRRLEIAGQLHDLGVTMTPHTAPTSEARHNLLQRARAMVYVHQRDEYHAIAPSRFALAAAYGLPILSEPLPDPTPFGHSHLMMSRYDYLAQFVREWTRPYNERVLEDYGRALHQFLCIEKPFRSWVEPAV